MPQTTILVFCYKYETLDRRKKFTKTIENQGVLLHSTTLYDNQIPAWVTKYCKNEKVLISTQSANLLSEYIGNDLSRIASEIDKLLIAIPPNSEITPELIEKNVGISKNFNNFELSKALFVKDIMLANRIVDYFGKNPKDFAIQVTLAVIFNNFFNLLHYHVLKDNSSQNAALRLGINPFFVKEYAQASKLYTPQKVREIISQIRIADAKSKGYGSINTAPNEILKELVFRILH
jgi:DNA polymerase-3 subunit delta